MTRKWLTQMMLFERSWQMYRTNVPGRWGVQCLRCGRKESYTSSVGCADWAHSHAC